MTEPVRVRGVAIGEGRPKICVPIVAETEREILEKAEELRKVPFDLAEWRADWYEAGSDPAAAARTLKKLRERIDAPILFTFRTRREGGERELGPEEYLALNLAAAESGAADLIDLELFTGSGIPGGDGKDGLCPDAGERLRSLVEAAHGRGVKVVMSSHDFLRTPSGEELSDRLARMEELGADLLKIAVMPESRRDVLCLLAATEEAARRRRRPLITMAMGSLGVISRLAGEAFGSAVTFGSAGTASAPGQMDAGRLKAALDALHESMEGAVPGKGRNGHIFLIGFMGTGKSTVAARLEKKSGRRVIEMDARIVRENGMEIREIFERFGEAYFRDLESGLIGAIGAEPPAIVSCGGGAVLRKANVEAMKARGTVVLLTARPETVLKRVRGDDSRPVLRGKKNPEAVAKLMEGRRAAYEAAADFTVATDDRTPEAVAEEILARLAGK